jgi:hypothetical protein
LLCTSSSIRELCASLHSLNTVYLSLSVIQNLWSFVPLLFHSSCFAAHVLNVAPATFTGFFFGLCCPLVRAIKESLKSERITDCHENVNDKYIVD